jgi:tetratricopeptide (TPR) repeat protein
MDEEQTMAVDMTTCPYCETPLPPDTVVCPACGEDLAGLLHLEYAHKIYYNEALQFAQDGDLEQARDSLLLCLRLHPSFAPAHGLMARLAAQSGEWARAREHAARAKALEPKNPTWDALLEALDEAEAQAKAAEKRAAEERLQEAQRAYERLQANHQKALLRAVGTGLVLGGVIVEMVRWLWQRRVEG